MVGNNKSKPLPPRLRSTMGYDGRRGMRIAIVAFATALLATAPAFGQSSGMTMDARSLLAACSTPDDDWISFCHGVVQAVHDASLMFGRTPICVPAGTSRAHLADLLASQASAAIAADPSTGDYLGVALAHAIFANEYPCGD